MGLKDLAKKAKAAHEVTLYDETFKFAELGVDEEYSAHDEGVKYVNDYFKEDVDKALEEEYGTLFKFYHMLKAGGEDISLAEYLGMGNNTLYEVVMTISEKLENEVHTERKELEKRMKDRMKAQMALQGGTQNTLPRKK